MVERDQLASVFVRGCCHRVCVGVSSGVRRGGRCPPTARIVAFHAQDVEPALGFEPRTCCLRIAKTCGTTGSHSDRWRVSLCLSSTRAAVSMETSQVTRGFADYRPRTRSMPARIVSSFAWPILPTGSADRERSSVTICDTFTTESRGRPDSRAERRTLRVSVPPQIAGHDHAHHRRDPTAVQGVALHDDHRSPIAWC